MSKKLGYTPEKYKKILMTLLDQNRFMATNEICKKTGMGYYTALKYLEELKKENKINVRKVGNRSIWHV